MKNYRFWLETNEGQLIEWRRLTRAQAMSMCRATQTYTPDNVKRYGWEETE
jgi:hypothetical protein